MEIGQICVKIAGRDAGKKCVVVEIIDNNFVLIDGETRRRKCNLIHLEPLEQTVDIKKGASHEAVEKVLQVLGITTRNTKQKKAAKRRRHLRKKKAKLAPKSPAKTKVVEAQTVPKTSAAPVQAKTTSAPKAPVKPVTSVKK
ncbi:MAG: 50S ribosomal protein L14e [Nanoarchaeota archaeon]